MRLRAVLTGLLTVAVAAPVAATVWFSDVPETHKHYEAVKEVWEKGLVEGFGDGRFGPDQPVRETDWGAVAARLWSQNVRGMTRGEMAEFLSHLPLKAHTGAGEGRGGLPATSRPPSATIPPVPVSAPVGGGDGWETFEHPFDPWPNHIKPVFSEPRVEGGEFVVPVRFEGVSDLREVEVGVEFRVLWWGRLGLAETGVTFGGFADRIYWEKLPEAVLKTGGGEVRVDCAGLAGRGLAVTAWRTGVSVDDEWGNRVRWTHEPLEDERFYVIDCSGDTKPAQPPTQAPVNYPTLEEAPCFDVMFRWPQRVKDLMPAYEDVDFRWRKQVYADGRWVRLRVETIPGQEHLSVLQNGACQFVYVPGYRLQGQSSEGQSAVAARSWVANRGWWETVVECAPWRKSVVLEVRGHGPESTHGNAVHEWRSPPIPLECPPAEAGGLADTQIEAVLSNNREVYYTGSGATNLRVEWTRPGSMGGRWEYRLVTDLPGCQEPSRFAWREVSPKVWHRRGMAVNEDYGMMVAVTSCVFYADWWQVEVRWRNGDGWDVARTRQCDPPKDRQTSVCPS